MIDTENPTGINTQSYILNMGTINTSDDDGHHTMGNASKTTWDGIAKDQYNEDNRLSMNASETGLDDIVFIHSPLINKPGKAIEFGEKNYVFKNLKNEGIILLEMNNSSNSGRLEFLSDDISIENKPGGVIILVDAYIDVNGKITNSGDIALLGSSSQLQLSGGLSNGAKDITNESDGLIILNSTSKRSNLPNGSTGTIKAENGDATILLEKGSVLISTETEDNTFATTNATTITLEYGTGAVESVVYRKFESNTIDLTDLTLPGPLTISQDTVINIDDGSTLTLEGPEGALNIRDSNAIITGIINNNGSIDIDENSLILTSKNTQVMVQLGVLVICINQKTEYGILKIILLYPVELI